MRHYTLLLLILVPFLTGADPEPWRIRSYINGHIERWEIELNGKTGSIEIDFKNDPNRWRYLVGEREVMIETYFKDHFGHWQFTLNGKHYDLETQHPGSWTKWQLSGDSLPKVRIETFYGESWDNWNFESATGRCSISTRIHRRFEDWEIAGPIDKLREAEQVAAVFMPIFVARIQQKNLNR